MQKLLVDSTIIVEYLKTGGGILNSVLEEYQVAASIVTYTELLAIKRASHSNINRQIRDFISEKFEVLPVTVEIAAKAGEFLREIDTSLAHAYIAATAIESDLALLTYDIKSFDKFPDLKLVEL